MAEKPEQNEELPFITLNTKEDVKKRKTGRAVSSPSSRLSQDEFRNMLSEAISSGSVISGELKNTYFLIDLNTEYYTPSVSSMLDGLELDVKTVLSETQIIVKGKKDDLEQVIKREKILKKFTKTIKRIQSLSSEQKLGSSLLEIMKQDASSTKVIPISIKFIDNLEKIEEQEFKRILYKGLDKDINKGTNPKYLHRSKQFICGSGSKRIRDLAKLPFIKSINNIPKIRAQEDESEELYLKKGEYELVPKNVKPVVCVIDSGVSESLTEFCTEKDKFIFTTAEDTKDHGTGVASVAIFGEDTIRKSKRLVQKTKIISFKIDDLEGPDVVLEEAVMKAVEKYKDKTKIFCLSYNYLDIDPEVRLDVVRKLDLFLQQQNVILVISGGNIDSSDALEHKKNYPSYLTKFPVLSPAETKNAVSAGSICNNSTNSNIILSVFTRMGLHPILIEDDKDNYRFFKPDIYTFGGNNELKPKPSGNGVQVSKELEIAVLSLNGNLVHKMGTSYAAPLIALCYARLMDKYNYSNSETYKAIMLSKANYQSVNSLPVHCIHDTSNVARCNDAIYLNFEGKIIPKIRAEDVKQTNILECKSAEFYMPEEADSIDIFTAHSNNYKFQDIRKYNTRLVVEIIKSNGKSIRKEYGTPNMNCPNTYAHYGFKRNYEGLWRIKVHVETRGIPSELLKELRARFGVSLRISLKKKEINNLKKVYRKVLAKSKAEKNKELSKTDEYVEERQKLLSEPVEIEKAALLVEAVH